MCDSTRSWWQPVTRSGCMESINVRPKLRFDEAETDLKHDAWVPVEKHLLCDRSSSVPPLTSPGNTHTLATRSSCLDSWSGTGRPDVSLNFTFFAHYLSSGIDLRCTTQIYFFSPLGCLLFAQDLGLLTGGIPSWTHSAVGSF